MRTWTLLLLSACLVEIPDDDTTSPTLTVRAAGGMVSSGDDPPGGDFVCRDVEAGPVTVTALASDAGGVSQIYVHLIEGRVVPGSVEVTPDDEAVTWELTVGDTPVTEGDDELTVTVGSPEPGRAYTAATLAFDVEATDVTTALQALATDASSNDASTWPLRLAHEGTHPPCSEL